MHGWTGPPTRWSTPHRGGGGLALGGRRRAPARPWCRAGSCTRRGCRRTWRPEVPAAGDGHGGCGAERREPRHARARWIVRRAVLRRTSFCISFFGGSIAATRALRPTGQVGSSGTAAARSACILTRLTGAYGRRCAGRSGLRCCSETPKPDAVATRQESARVHLSAMVVVGCPRIRFGVSRVMRTKFAVAAFLGGRHSGWQKLTSLKHQLIRSLRAHWPA